MAKNNKNKKNALYVFIFIISHLQSLVIGAQHNGGRLSSLKLEVQVLSKKVWLHCQSAHAIIHGEHNDIDRTLAQYLT